MHLGDGGGGQGRLVELLEQLADGLAEGRFHLGAGFAAGEGWHLVLEFRQLVGDIQRQEVPAGGQDLAEFHVDGA